MDSSYEEIEESMQELVQRAEAFLSAYPSTSGSSSSGGSSGRPSVSFGSGSGSSSNNSSHILDDSFTTAGNSSLSSISRNDDSIASGSSSVSAGNDLSMSSTSSGDASRLLNLSQLTGESSSANSSVVSSLERTNSEDCVVVPFADVPQVIDLCSPRVQRLLVRRIANAAPIVDSITLDDTINEMPPPEVRQLTQQQFRPPPEPSRSAAVVVNEYLEGPPPVKRSKESPLDLSQSSEGCSQEPAVAVSCPICFDSIFRKQASSTICGHLFCHDCISQEIQLRKQCPLCKRKLARNHIHPIYFN